jgi:hypothetical protein
MKRLNEEVTKFLDSQNHPLRTEIEFLRNLILDSFADLAENIKWNVPNYNHNGDDRITMKIQPPKQIQLVFHRGAKVKEQRKTRLITNDTELLVWKANDRAIASFKILKDIEQNKNTLIKIIDEWINTHI